MIVHNIEYRMINSLHRCQVMEINLGTAYMEIVYYNSGATEGEEAGLS